MNRTFWKPVTMLSSIVVASGLGLICISGCDTEPADIEHDGLEELSSDWDAPEGIVAEAKAHSTGLIHHAYPHGYATLVQPGTVPLFEGFICCDATGGCTAADPAGCATGTVEYYCHFGEEDPTNGQFDCYVEDQSTPSTTGNFICCQDLNLNCSEPPAKLHGLSCHPGDKAVQCGDCSVVVDEDGSAHCGC